ncbi:unnamed protein product [Paramecium pentaurelia]|uniref:Uncharacterized protein n=1 Tax=Paramecium pentaurelia TaxID=43138 RepID=A0A8S1ULK3_9CILI|nr:unnamed protein product [Paramecium pentaurelia]
MQELSQNTDFSYKLVSNYHQAQSSQAIAINRYNTLLLVSALKKIKVFYFKNKQLKYNQIINKHSDEVTTLNFFQIKPWFISGSRDGSIIIWPTSLMKYPKYIMKFKGHSNWINCVVLQPLNQDLIISFSKDSTIKFWSVSNTSCMQTIRLINQDIYSSSINNQGNKLIACSNNNQILVLEEISCFKWIITQRIVVQNFGYRLSFITNNIFAFQSHKQANLQIYYLNALNQTFSKMMDVQIQGGDQPCNLYFPMIYVPSKNCLLVKNGYKLNLISIVLSKEEELLECKLQQVIDFKKVLWSQIFGTISQDGQFLITWDYKSFLIQIREYVHHL